MKHTQSSNVLNTSVDRGQIMPNKKVSEVKTTVMKELLSYQNDSQKYRINNIFNYKLTIYFRDY